MSSSKIHTKEMICCIIVIVVGCLTAFSDSTAISASSRSSSTVANDKKANFNGNGILRDDDASQDIGFAVPASASPMKSHKKRISGGFNANGLNGNDASSPDDLARDDSHHMNPFDDNGDDDDADDSSDFVSIEIDDQLSLKDQMRMLTAQMTKRFQHELKAAVRKTTKDLFKADFQSQLEQLR